MASIPASITLVGVSKSGSPISRWIMLLPWASSARALASVSNAVSVPRRAIRLASRSPVGVITVLMFLFCSSEELFVDRLFLALRSQHVRHGIRNAPGWFLEVTHLEIAQQSQRQHLSTKHNQHRGRDQHRPVLAHYTQMPDQFGKHETESNAHAAQQREHAHGAEQVQRPVHIFQ